MRCAVFLAFIGAGAQAQNSIRPSSIGAVVTDMRQEQAPANRGNFMRFGPVDVNAVAGMAVEFNDNVRLAEKDRTADIIFRPQLGVESEWRVSGLNTIRFGMDLSYAKYADHSELDTQSLMLAPGTQLAFNVGVGEHLRLNFHDRIQITQNPLEEATLSNVERFARLQNSAGVTAFIRFPDLEFVLGYDHFDYHSLSSDFDYLNRAEEQFIGSARRRVNDAMGIGLDASAALVDYAEQVNNDGTTWTAGAFADATLSEYTKLRLSAGYQSMSFDGNGSNGDESNFGGWYANLAAAQRLTQYWSHSLTIGREARLGLAVNFADFVYARYAASWRMNSVMTWSFDAFVEDAKESGGADLNAEHAFRWGGGPSLQCTIANRMTLGLHYGYVNKDSDLTLRSYYQNSATISLHYQF